MKLRQWMPVVLLAFGLLPSLAAVGRARATEPEDVCELQTLFAEKRAAKEFADWHAWWRKATAGGAQTRLLAIRKTKGAVSVQLVACHPPGAGGKKSEGSRQWLLWIDRGRDGPRLLNSVTIGLQGCCGGRWWTEPSIDMQDMNRDGVAEIKLAGRFEDGSDSHWLKADAELYVFPSQRKKPAVIRPEPGTCAPVLSYLDKLDTMALLVKSGEFTCTSDWCGHPELKTIQSKLRGRLLLGKSPKRRFAIQYRWTPVHEDGEKPNPAPSEFTTTRWLSWNPTKGSLSCSQNCGRQPASP